MILFIHLRKNDKIRVSIVTSRPSTAAMLKGKDRSATSSSLVDPKASAMISSVSDSCRPSLLRELSSHTSRLEQSSWSLKIMSFCQMSPWYAMDTLAATSLILSTGMESILPTSTNLAALLFLAPSSADLPHLKIVIYTILLDVDRFYNPQKILPHLHLVIPFWSCLSRLMKAKVFTLTVSRTVLLYL